MTRMTTFQWILLVAFILGCRSLVSAQTSLPVSWQARLTNPDGSVIADGTYTFSFTIYSAETGGAIVEGPILVPSVLVQNGIASVAVPMSPASFTGSPRYIGVKVGSGAELTPRTLVTSVPQSLSLGGVATGSAATGVVLRDAAGKSANMQVDLTGGYQVFRDDVGMGLDPTRLWLQAPDKGEVVVGPRSGSRLLDHFSVRAREVSLGNNATNNPPVYISAEGLVGIGSGSSNPSGRMSVRETQTNRYGLRVRNDVGNAGVYIQTTSGGVAAPLVIDNGDDRLFTVYENGTTSLQVLRITGGSDLAEPFLASPVESQAVEPKPGMVLSIDPEHPGALRVSTAAYDSAVAGVYSGGNGLPTGMLMGKEGCDLTSLDEEKLPLAMTGRVWVYADESNGVIKPGDRLTTSGLKPGYAMKVTNSSKADGAVIGKAMTCCDAKTGMVLVLVNLQ